MRRAGTDGGEDRWWGPRRAGAAGAERCLTFVVVAGGGQGALVDVVRQEAVQGIFEGGESGLVIGVQDRALMFVQMLQEAGGGRDHTQPWSG